MGIVNWLRDMLWPVKEFGRQLERDTRPSIQSDINVLMENDPHLAEALRKAEREWARNWNEVFAQEAKAHREGRRWDWDKYSGQRPEDIAALAEADGHTKPSESEARPWRQ